MILHRIRIYSPKIDECTKINTTPFGIVSASRLSSYIDIYVLTGESRKMGFHVHSRANVREQNWRSFILLEKKL